MLFCRKNQARPQALDRLKAVPSAIETAAALNNAPMGGSHVFASPTATDL